MTLSYPPSRREERVENLHGTPVADPYRWLEDDRSPETSAWVAAQNKLTFSYLERASVREHFHRRITELWDFEKFGVPFRKKNRVFFTRNDGLQNQAVLYWLDSLDGEPRLLLDPNKLSSDGTVALSATSVSGNGEYLAYSLSEAGSDWQEWRVRVVNTGEDLPDRVHWAKFTGASWTKDNQGFFYSRYDAPGKDGAYKEANYYQKIYYHRLGTTQEEDALIYQRPDKKEWGFGGEVSDDGNHLIISVWYGTFQENGVFYQHLHDPAAPVVELFCDFDATYQFLGNDGELFYFLTNKNALRGQIVAVDINNPQPENWKVIVPQAEDSIESAQVTGSQLFITTMHDAYHQIAVYDLNGILLNKIASPGLGTVMGFGGSRLDKDTFYHFSSFTTPGLVYHYDLETGKSRIFRQPTLRFDPTQYITEQVFYPSKDGTRIPMFITYKKGLVRDGQNNTYLYGYGGFNISLPPAFEPARIAWMETGGVFAQPNLRGGGEYGKAWHDAGKLHNKRNVFDDFISAAEWLIDNGYTKRSRLAIHGRSNGGLLTGACLTQRPDLYGAVIVTVGVLDMLRFHLWTIGWAWVSDYGSPDTSDDFSYLLSYSPYHNIRHGTAYPPTLITTGDHDDRVFPAHSFKFAAALQAAQSGNGPILIRIDVRAGHGVGKPTAKIIAETADIFTFIANTIEE
ncbi:MAG: S9 family peptidase [Anaerolineaceae bacterium]|nr:S9 family peptidase [Anaerolineaceae bacterium]